MPGATGTTATAPSKAAGSTTLSGAPTSEFSEDAYGRERHPGVLSPHDDEPAVSGWGGYEDEDGMGML